MKPSTTTRRGVFPRPVALAIVAALALALPATAQDPSGSPAPSAAAPEGIAFPIMLGGELLKPETYSGEEWLARFAEGENADPAFVADTEALLESVGKTAADLTVKTALYEPSAALFEFDDGTGTADPVATEPAVLAALRIDGTDARDWAAMAVDVMVGDVTDPGLVLRPIDTKWTLRVTDAADPGVYPRTLYLKDDTAWIIQGDDQYVLDALGQLPAPAPVGPSSADGLYTDLPMTLGGARRLGLYESTEPLFLPSFGERIGADLDRWLVDLYLEGGISPSEMLGVIAWWGLEGSQDGIQIEGYRLPDGNEAFTQRLLDEVFLATPPEVDPNAAVDEPIDPSASRFAGVDFSDEQIAGRDVRVLDFGGAIQYIFGSADTIWVVNDPLGDRALVEEAIAALP